MVVLLRSGPAKHGLSILLVTEQPFLFALESRYLPVYANEPLFSFSYFSPCILESHFRSYNPLRPVSEQDIRLVIVTHRIINRIVDGRMFPSTCWPFFTLLLLTRSFTCVAPRKLDTDCFDRELLPQPIAILLGGDTMSDSLRLSFCSR